MLLDKIAEAAQCGVDFIQLREKDLSTRELESLAGDAMQVIAENSPRDGSNGRPATRLLINSRTDVAIACKAAGVHLRSSDISPNDARLLWGRSFHVPKEPAIISVSCHKVGEVAFAAENGADFVVFGPVFEKRKDSQPTVADAALTGLNTVKEACHQEIPVIALGGITPENAQVCMSMGAAGVAGIRLFQDNEICDVVSRLRG